MTVLSILEGLLPADAELTEQSDLRQFALSSLTMTRLWFLLRKEYGVDIPVTELGECNTAAELTQRVASASSTPVQAPAAPVSFGDRHEPFGLSDLQQAYLIAKDPQFSADPIGCHVYREFKVDGLDVERLEHAWRKVVRRHDMLRAVVTPDGKQQVRAEMPPTSILPGVPYELSHRRYSPGDWPMWTVATDADDTVLLSIDVMLVDGHGLSVILEDWWRCYTDPSYEIPEPRTTVRDLMLALETERKSDSYREHLDYWSQRLADLPSGPDLGPGSTTRHALTGSLSPGQWTEVTELAAQWEVSPTALVLTLFAEIFDWEFAPRPFSIVLTTNHRARLPLEAETEVGPFTSSLIMPMASTVDRPLREAAVSVHKQLRSDLDHAVVSGVAATRKLRSRASTPVVFTSMLGIGKSSPLQDSVTYALSQTSGITLDHQMWEQEGELQIRWDTSLPGPVVEPLFARLMNSLCALTTAEPEIRPLNELQQAYFVPRAMGAAVEWNGCQVHHTFPVAELDLGRLESAWLRACSAFDVMRTVVGHDGKLHVSPKVPERCWIPVIQLSDVDDAEGYLRQMGETLVSRAVPLGRGPQSDLRVTIDAAGAATVHLVTDLTMLDGRSIHFLVREFFRLYAEDSAVPAPPSPFQARPAEKSDREHWHDRVNALPPGPKLPGSDGGAQVRVRRVARLAGWSAVRQQAEATGLRPDDLLAAALSKVFARHYGAPLSVPYVRWTAASMPSRPAEFTAMSWVTCSDADSPLWTLAREIRATLAEDERHDSVSGLAELRKRIVKERRTGSFDLPVVYTELYDLREQPLPAGVTLGPWMTCTPDVSLDSIAIEESTGELHVYWDSIDSHFPAGQLDQLFAEFTAELQALCWNQTARPYTAPGPIQVLFEQQARKRPGAVALQWDGGVMTYGELNRAANGVAKQLRKLGVKAGTPVGVSVPRGPAMAVSVYGILKAGGFYVPIEPSLPPDRAASIVTDSGLTLLLTTTDRQGWTVPSGLTCVAVDDVQPEARNTKPVNGPDDTAYVIFTSGSTGKPKGVAVSHRPLHNLLNWCFRTHGFGPDDLGLCVTSLGFDLSVFDLLGLLACGAGVYIASAQQQKDPDLLLDVLINERVTFWNSAPTTLNQLAPLFPARQPSEHLRLVYLSGDYTPLPLPDQVRSVFPNAQIVSLGGATEATVWSNSFEVGEIDPTWRSIPYGRPMDNSQYYVLDEHLRPCPVGVEGDLYIGGDCLSLGYFNQPDLTAERFLPDPFTVDGSGRIYATGDRALFFPDGNICFMGRADGQVKIRGFRVELGEIEYRLRSHGGVKDVVVLARPDHSGDKKLVAYVQPIDFAAPPAVAELRKHAAGALPDYMVPNVVSYVDNFPATSNGKLDRESLPWPVTPGSSHTFAPSSPATAAPATPAEAARPASEPEPAVDLAPPVLRHPTGAEPEAAKPPRPAATVPVPTALPAIPTVFLPAPAASAPASAAALPAAAAAGSASAALASAGPASAGSALAGSPPSGSAASLPSVPEPVAAASASAAPAAAPVAAFDFTEELAAIFAEVLGVSTVDPYEDVWDQGATSFTMVQVSAALQARHGQKVPVSTLLAEPTVAGIARTLAPAVTASAPSPVAADSTALPGGASAADAVPAADGASAASAASSAFDAVAPEQKTTAPSPWFTPAATGDAAAGEAVEEVDFFSAESRDRFKQARHDLRQGGLASVKLTDATGAGERLSRRVTHREFDQRPITAVELSGLLSLLRETQVGGKARRLYPSAGDTYAVQVYLHVKPGAVEGVEPGLHYYHPVEHALKLIEPHPTVERSMHFVYNRPIFDQSTVDIYLYGQRKAIAPLYGADAERFMLLEAGYLGQTLMQGQADFGIGLCPIGNIAHDSITRQLGLDDTHVYLQAFLAGPALHQARPQKAEVAIVGVAGRFPGASDLDEYWNNLHRGRCSLTQIPERAGEGASLGGFLSDVEGFDSLLFHVSPQEAANLDPQLRLLLHTVWDCLETSGHTAASLNAGGDRVGVFLGAMWQDFRQVGADRWQAGQPALISATSSEAANRVSHFFGFTGPSVAIDTSCSSSLAALHLAVESLRRGECDSAVVAAANLLTHAYHLDLLNDMGLLAVSTPEGAFDAAVPGWSPGEGVAALLLRLKPEAAADGDTIYASVEHTAIGHLGGEGRFGTPNAGSLSRSITAAISDAGLSTSDIGYVECAAAGAVLADAAEIEALNEVFADRDEPLPIGTVKPNIGHLEAAAGLSQLVKVLLQLQHGQIAPTLVSGQLSPLVSWDKVRPVETLTAWTQTRRAMVNAVGATGSYGHAILSGAGDSAPAEQEAEGSSVITLSAESAEQLVAMAGRLYRFLIERRPVLASVAFTLQNGRASLRHRLAVSCADTRQLGEALEAFGRGQTHPALRVSVAEPGLGLVMTASVQEATQAWLQGYEVDWSQFNPVGKRIALPTYPFATDLSPRQAPSAPKTDPTDYLRALYSELSGIPFDKLHPRVPLEHYGLTSLLIAQLNERLERDFPGDEVSKTLFFEHPDLGGVAGELAKLKGTTSPASTAPSGSARSIQPQKPQDDRIAVIGMAGRYPQAPDLEAFWSNLTQGKDAIAPLPAQRRRPEWTDEAQALMVGGFLDDVEHFDPLFFGITPRDAATMDPQERLFLEVAWHTLENAGYSRTALRDRHDGRVAVFVGSMYNEFPFFGLATQEPVGSAIAGIANRVSYFLDLNGPSMTVDTMCSSSLTAIHLAAAALRRGESDLALVGGVNLSLHPNKFQLLRDMKMSSSDHRCRSFGADGDGFVPGEGVGAVLLKPLARAIADGDRVLGVIAGTSINHDGKTNGYTVPNPLAQADLVSTALLDASLEPAAIGYLEAHGTGTSLGDPVEINGLSRAYGGLKPGSCAIGSVKSQIGHLEAAAGIAGLTKVLLQLQHGMMVPSLHAEKLNPNINWSGTPFHVQRDLTPWRDDTPRRAGISSFGAGGANAHVIVEGHTLPPSTPDTGDPRLIVLSARTEDQLRQVASALAAHLRAHELSLADVAYTLQTGREHLKERLAVIVSSVPDLLSKLDSFDGLRGRATIPSLEDVLTSGSLKDQAHHWLTGGAVAWPLHQGRKVALPGYPFARMRCWPTFTTPPAPATPPVGRAPLAPAPLAFTPAPLAFAPPAPSAPKPTASGLVASTLSLDFGSTAPAAPVAAAEPLVSPVPLATRTWVQTASTSDAEDTGAGGSDTIVCLYREDQRQLAERVAEALRPAHVLLTHDSLPGDVDGWLDLCALSPQAAGEERDHGPWGERLELLQRILAARPGRVRAVQVTSGLFGPGGVAPTLAGARLAGFVRNLGAELPWVDATVLDVDQPDEQVIARVWRSFDEHGEISVRAGVAWRSEFTRYVPSGTVPSLNPDKVYLVTGGTRGLGRLAAQHLVARGARKLALFGVTPGSQAVVAGAQTFVHIGQLTDRHAVTAFLDRLRAEAGEIGGVLHCAGRSSAGRPSLLHKELASIRSVLEPKGDGLDTLAALTAGDPLEFFVLYSSVSGVIPALSVGVADYAAANSYLDYFLGHQLRSGRTHFRAVNWPVWRETGGGVDRPDACASVGLDSLADSTGLGVLDCVLGSAGTPASPVLPLPGTPDLGTLLKANRPPTAKATPKQETVTQDSGWLTELFAEALGIPESELDTSETFGNLGVESVLLTELLEMIEAKLDRPLEPTTLLEFDTIDSLAAHLGPIAAPIANQAAATQAPVASLPQAATLPGPDAETQDRRVAVIGMACRFPGSPDIDSFWRLLREGRSAIVEVPEGRWDKREFYPQRTVSKWGGFLEGLEDFDPGYFGMSDGEAKNMDPAIRLTLEATASCLADAGYTEDELGGRDIGVFMGARMSHYRKRISTAQAATGLGGDQNFIAARVAHQFDFHGPNLVVDSACSSSLVSVQLAIQSLLSGESEVAFAGGVDVLLDEEPYLEFTAAKALSPNGRCATFDKAADGFVPGEGVAVLLLKPLARAIADGDRIHAVINAVAVGNDGHTMGLTTPNPVAQGQVVRRALQRAGLTAEDIGMVEAHGTATMIGDPIEVRALTDVYRKQTDRAGYCAIGSVKSNFGHLLSAAGIAGLVKILLALEHAEIPPTLHCETPNPRFDFAASPFFPNTGLRPWNQQNRAAGVSAFGLGGTNAHLIATSFEVPGVTRKPLPQPVFSRRRLWWDRTDRMHKSSEASNGQMPAGEAVPTAKAPTLVASVLELNFA